MGNAVIIKIKIMCRIKFKIETTGQVTSATGRYRKVGATSWSNFTIDVNDPQTPDVTDLGEYEMQVNVNSGNWVNAPNFFVKTDCNGTNDEVPNIEFVDVNCIDTDGDGVYDKAYVIIKSTNGVSLNDFEAVVNGGNILPSNVSVNIPDFPKGGGTVKATVSSDDVDTTYLWTSDCATFSDANSKNTSITIENDSTTEDKTCVVKVKVCNGAKCVEKQETITIPKKEGSGEFNPANAAINTVYNMNYGGLEVALHCSVPDCGIDFNEDFTWSYELLGTCDDSSEIDFVMVTPDNPSFKKNTRVLKPKNWGADVQHSEQGCFGDCTSLSVKVKCVYKGHTFTKTIPLYTACY